MKTIIKILMVVIAITTSSLYSASKLSFASEYIKKNYVTNYEKNIKYHALVKWKDDYSMVVYSINGQTKALEIIESTFESVNTQILFNAIQKWGYSNYKLTNIAIFRKIKTLNIKSLLYLHCDWEMVLYIYKQQVEAKNSF